MTDNSHYPADTVVRVESVDSIRKSISEAHRSVKPIKYNNNDNATTEESKIAEDSLSSSSSGGDGKMNLAEALQILTSNLQGQWQQCQTAAASQLVHVQTQLTDVVGPEFQKQASACVDHSQFLTEFQQSLGALWSDEGGHDWLTVDRFCQGNQAATSTNQMNLQASRIFGEFKQQDEEEKDQGELKEEDNEKQPQPTPAPRVLRPYGSNPPRTTVMNKRLSMGTFSTTSSCKEPSQEVMAVVSDDDAASIFQHSVNDFDDDDDATAKSVEVEAKVVSMKKGRFAGFLRGKQQQQHKIVGSICEEQTQTQTPTSSRNSVSSKTRSRKPLSRWLRSRGSGSNTTAVVGNRKNTTVRRRKSTSGPFRGLKSAFGKSRSLPNRAAAIGLHPQTMDEDGLSQQDGLSSQHRDEYDDDDQLSESVFDDDDDEGPEILAPRMPVATVSDLEPSDSKVFQPVRSHDASEQQYDDEEEDYNDHHDELQNISEEQQDDYYSRDEAHDKQEEEDEYYQEEEDHQQQQQQLQDADVWEDVVQDDEAPPPEDTASVQSSVRQQQYHPARLQTASRSRNDGDAVSVQSSRSMRSSKSSRSMRSSKSSRSMRSSKSSRSMRSTKSKKKSKFRSARYDISDDEGGNDDLSVGADSGDERASYF